MFKSSIFFFIVLISSAYSKNISENKVVKNKNSFQVNSCKNITCVQGIQKYIHEYDYITTVNNKIYVTHIVNINTKDIKKVRNKLKKYFPDMILRNKAPSAANILHSKKESNNNNPLFIEKYTLALDNFKKKNYEKSYTLLKQLFEEKTDNPNINFYLGRSAYETKRYAEAVSSYELFLFMEPNNDRVKLEMARAFFMTKIYQESKNLLLEVKNNPKIPLTTLKIVNYYLQSIDNQVNKHSINGILMAGVLYDSNINSRSKHDTFNNVYIPAANLYLDLTNTTEDASNWYNQEIVVVNHKYKLSDNKKVKQDFTIFNKDSFDSTYDNTKVTLLSYSPSLSVQYNNQLTIDYGLYLDYLKYAGRDKLKTYALFPKFNYLYNAQNKIQGYLKYQKKSDQQNHQKDSTYAEINTNLTHTYNKQFSLRSDITIADETAKYSTQTGIDYLNIKGKLSLNYKYKPNLIIAPSLVYSVTKYDDMDSFFLAKAKNKLFKMALSTTYIHSPQWIIHGNIDKTRQNSNITPNEYDKYSFGLNLIRTF